MEYIDVEILPDRIIGMKRLEALFKQTGHCICQSCGERIYDFNEIVAIFLPLDSEHDQLMAVHSDHATTFLMKCLITLR